MKIPQPVINTFNRVGIDYKTLLAQDGEYYAVNRFSGDKVLTNKLIASLVGWVYQTSDDYEEGKNDVKVSDFDRIRYFIAKIAPEVYSTCID
jgi:hypothetical protein